MTNYKINKNTGEIIKDENLGKCFRQEPWRDATEVIIGADGRGGNFTGKTMNNFSIYSDTSSTIQYRATDSGTWNLQIFCFGWVDYQL